jgi:hypothetical protein
MQPRDFGQAGSTQESSELNKCLPTVVVWPSLPPSLGSNVPDQQPKPYSLLDGQALVARWMGDSATIQMGRTDDPMSIFDGGLLTGKTKSHSPDCEMRFYSQGIDSLGYFPIEGSTCVYTDPDGSYLLRPNGGMQGPYPWNPRLSMRPAAMRTPTKPSQQASEVSSQHHPGIRQVLYSDSVGGYSNDYSNIPLTVNPCHLIRNPPIDDSGYGGSACFNDQRVEDKPPSDHFSNGKTGGAGPCGSFDEGLGDEMFGHTGEHFDEIGDVIEWIENE